MDAYKHLNFHPVKERKSLYVLRNTGYHDLTLACYMFRVHLGYISKDLLVTLLHYLPDAEVERQKQRLVRIYMKNTMVCYWAKEVIVIPDRVTVECCLTVAFVYKPQWLSRKKFMGIIVRGYAKAVCAGASEEELSDWHKLIGLLRGPNRVGCITWYKIFGHTYQLILDGNDEEICNSFVLQFRP